MEKTCLKCEQALPNASFAVDARRKDGLQVWCRACRAAWRKANADRQREYSRQYRQRAPEQAYAWHKAHPERCRAAQQRWRDRNRETKQANTAARREAMVAAGGLTYIPKPLRARVYRAWGERCLACGAEDRVSLDHVVSILEGGKTTFDNLQPLCVACNTRKGRRTSDYRPSPTHHPAPEREPACD